MWRKGRGADSHNGVKAGAEEPSKHMAGGRAIFVACCPALYV